MHQKPKSLACSLILVAAIAVSFPAAAQDQPTSPPTQQESEDVVVTGLRDLNDAEPSVTTRNMMSGYTGAGPGRSKNAFWFSEQFARCAVKRTSGNLQRLKRVLDSRTNSSMQAGNQTRLVQLHSTCTENPAIARSTNVDASATLPEHYDGTYYDRGALYVEAIIAFAPDLELTNKQLADPAVQARFNARETSLARFRLPQDRQFFQIAICVVRKQPELALDLVRTREPLAKIGRIEASMVNRSMECLGGAKQVYFDPMQFRFYIADALYRWAVAAKGVESLVPDL